MDYGYEDVAVTPKSDHRPGRRLSAVPSYLNNKQQDEEEVDYGYEDVDVTPKSEHRPAGRRLSAVPSYLGNGTKKEENEVDYGYEDVSEPGHDKKAPCRSSAGPGYPQDKEPDYGYEDMDDSKNDKVEQAKAFRRMSGVPVYTREDAPPKSPNKKKRSASIVSKVSVPIEQVKTARRSNRENDNAATTSSLPCKIEQAIAFRRMSGVPAYVREDQHEQRKDYDADIASMTASSMDRIARSARRLSLSTIVTTVMSDRPSYNREGTMRNELTSELGTTSPLKRIRRRLSLF